MGTQETGNTTINFRHVRDFHGRDVTGELFGTFLSIEIRDFAETLVAVTS